MNPVCCLCGHLTEGSRPTLLFQTDDGTRHYICRDCHQALYDLTCTTNAIEAESAIAAVMRRMTATSEDVEAYVHTNVFAIYAQGAPKMDEADAEGEPSHDPDHSSFLGDLNESAQSMSTNLRNWLRLAGRDSALQRITLFSGIMVAVLLLIGLPLILIDSYNVHPLLAVAVGIVVATYFVCRALLAARRGNRLEALMDEHTPRD